MLSLVRIKFVNLNLWDLHAIGVEQILEDQGSSTYVVVAFVVVVAWKKLSNMASSQVGTHAS